MEKLFNNEKKPLANYVTPYSVYVQVKVDVWHRKKKIFISQTTIFGSIPPKMSHVEVAFLDGDNVAEDRLEVKAAGQARFLFRFLCN